MIGGALHLTARIRERAIAPTVASKRSVMPNEIEVFVSALVPALFSTVDLAIAPELISAIVPAFDPVFASVFISTYIANARRPSMALGAALPVVINW